MCACICLYQYLYLSIYLVLRFQKSFVEIEKINYIKTHTQHSSFAKKLNQTKPNIISKVKGN